MCVCFVRKVIIIILLVWL